VEIFTLLTRQNRWRTKKLKMNIIQKVFGLLAMSTLLILLLVAGCKKDDPILRDTSYNLKVEDVLGVNGTANFTEYNNGTTTIDIVLENAPSGTYSVSLCQNSAVEGGATVIELNRIELDQGIFFKMMNFYRNN
jgi:hypothetical protein